MAGASRKTATKSTAKESTRKAAAPKASKPAAKKPVAKAKAVVAKPAKTTAKKTVAPKAVKPTAKPTAAVTKTANLYARTGGPHGVKTMAAPKKKKEEHSSIHNCYDPEMRLLIAWRIRDERMKLFPNMGGAKKCAAAYGVSQQQWSLYESGGRTPNDSKLAQIAKLFKVTLDHMKTPPDNWPEIRKRLLRLKKSKELIKLDRLDEELEPDDDFESSLEAGNGQEASDIPANGGQADAPVENTNDFPQQPAVSIGALIDQIIAVDKMHDKGQIPTQVFNFAMESISDDLLKLAAKHRSGQER